MANILLNPENIAAWTLTSAAVDADVQQAPDGTTTMDRLKGTGGGVGAVFATQNVDVSVNTLHTLSVFAYADGLDFGALGLIGFTTPGTTLQYFNAATGELLTDQGLDDYGVEDYGGGLYRPYVSFTTDPVDTNGTVRLYLAEADADNTVNRDGTSSLILWGALLEEGGLQNYTSVAGQEIINASRPPFIAITRRRAKDMVVHQRMPKPRRTLRGEFE